MTPKKFIAGRKDGMGERLNAIYNGMLLAELTGISIDVIWPDSRIFKDQDQSLDKPEIIFSQKFINKYFAKDTSLEGLKPLPLPQIVESITKSSLEHELENNNCLVPQGVIPIEITERLGNTKFAKKEVLRKLEYSKKIRTVKNIIKGISIPKNSIAIHIRAGDIIYGKHKEAPTTVKKVISAPAAAALIKKLRASGKKPILFGQDATCIGNLSARFNIPIASQFYPKNNWDRIDVAMADIFLMTQCEAIYSGASGFSRFAAQISNAKLLGLQDLMPLKEWAREIRLECEEHRDCYTPEQVSYSLFSAYTYIKSRSDFPELNALLGKAVAECPTNVMFRFFQALNAYRFHDVALGEKIMFDLLHEVHKTSTKWLHKAPIIILLQRRVKAGGLASFFTTENKAIDHAVQNGGHIAKLLQALITEHQETRNARLLEFLEIEENKPFTNIATYFFPEKKLP